MVLNIHKLGDDCVHADTLTDLDRNDQTGIVFRRAKAVDTGHGRDNDNIPARQQGMGSRVPELVDVVVDGRVLFNICVRVRDVRLGLIVVIVRDEVDHSVVGKELFELARKLSGERFIRSHDQRRLSQGLNSLCHREGLARTSHAQQNLIAVSVPHTLHKRLNGFRLRACRVIGRHDLKRHVRAFNAKALKFTTNAFYFKFRHGYS